jgi:hypothetical protein
MKRTGFHWLRVVLLTIAGTCGLSGIMLAQPALPQPDTQQPALAQQPKSAAGQPAATQGAAATNADSTDWGPGLHSVLKNPPNNSAAAAASSDEPPLVIIPPSRIADPNVHPAAATGAPGSGVVPAAGTSTAAAEDAASRAAAIAAADLLNAALSPTKEKPLVGRFWTLLEAESVATGDRNRQMLIARAYWILSATQADYGWAVEESGRLDVIPAGRNPLDSALLSAAQASATARIQEARVAVTTAQQGLADVLAQPGGSPLPLVSDPPMVGAYRTYFDTLFAQRAAPSRLRLIDRTMPLRREVIETRAATVQASSSAVHFADEALAKPQSEVQLQTVLDCHASLSHERRAFLAAVRDYNLDIAEYALNVADPTLPNERLVGMLIPIKPLSSTGSAASHEPDLSKPPADDPLMRSALPAAGDRPKAAHEPGHTPRTPGAAPAGSPLGGAPPAASPATPPLGAAGATSGGDAPAFGRQLPAFSGTTPSTGGNPSPSGSPPATGGSTSPGSGTTPAFGGTPPAFGGPAPSSAAPATSAASGPVFGGGAAAPDGTPKAPPLAAPASGLPPPARSVSP